MEVLRMLGTSERAVSEVVQGLDVVRTLLGNIARDPEEKRFRSIRKTNARIVPLLGREEEALLRAAGFSDDGEALSCYWSESSSDATDHVQDAESRACLCEVLDAVKVAHDVLHRHLEEAAGGSELRCLDADVSRALDCTLLDYVGQQSAEAAERHKRRRIEADAIAVRSPIGWQEVFEKLDCYFLLDGGPLQAWLSSNSSNRVLAHELLELQVAAARWYGDRAQHYCDEWRRNLSESSSKTKAKTDAGCSSPVPDKSPYYLLFHEELQRLREALFEFPEQPGAAPSLFQSVILPQSGQELAESNLNADETEADGAVVLIQTTDPEQTKPEEVVALE